MKVKILLNKLKLEKIFTDNNYKQYPLALACYLTIFRVHKDS